jgi:hypothetical protein
MVCMVCAGLDVKSLSVPNLGGKMPIRRRTLTQAERAEHLARTEQLRASGVDIEITEAWQERNCPLEIIVAPYAVSAVYEFGNGGIGYAPFVRLTARAGLTITDSDITTKWDDQIVMESFRDLVCRLGTVEYRQSEVLNQRIERGLRLSRGEIVEGYILATGLRRVPTEYGAAAPFGIVLSDQFGDPFHATGMLSVLRQVQRDNTKMRRGTGLNGMDATGRPRELSVEEESRRRYRELVAQDRLAVQKKVSPVTDDSR